MPYLHSVDKASMIYLKKKVVMMKKLGNSDERLGL